MPTSTVSERLATKAKAAYERAFQMEQQMNIEGKKKQHRSSQLPHYVPADKEARWKQNFEYDKKPKVRVQLFDPQFLVPCSFHILRSLSVHCCWCQVTPKPLVQVMVSVTPHDAAATGNLNALQALVDVDRANLFKRDQNGWRPLHEAARGGHTDVIEYLLKEGAKVNERTNNGEGGTPLWWAEKKPEKNKEAIQLLKNYGGLSLQPKVLDGKEKNDPKKEKEGDTA